MSKSQGHASWQLCIWLQAFLVPDTAGNSSVLFPISFNVIKLCNGLAEVLVASNGVRAEDLPGQTPQCRVRLRRPEDRRRKRPDKRRTNNRVLHQENVPVHTTLAGEQFLPPPGTWRSFPDLLTLLI